MEGDTAKISQAIRNAPTGFILVLEAFSFVEEEGKKEKKVRAAFKDLLNITAEFSKIDSSIHTEIFG